MGNNQQEKNLGRHSKRSNVFLLMMLGGLISIIVVGGGGILIFKVAKIKIQQNDGGIVITDGSNSGSQAIGQGNNVAGESQQNGGTQIKGDFYQINYPSSSQLPGLPPQESFLKPSSGVSQPPLDVSKYTQAISLASDMILAGKDYVSYGGPKILILGKRYAVKFRLSGDPFGRMGRRVGFELDGKQKGVLLQFGLEDLTAGTNNFIYKVKISVDGIPLWEGDCRYGQQNQIVSVPLSIPDATSLVIDYAVQRAGGASSTPKLYFTTSDLIFQ
jgi:hypothetical protein